MGNDGSDDKVVDLGLFRMRRITSRFRFFEVTVPSVHTSISALRKRHNVTYEELAIILDIPLETLLKVERENNEDIATEFHWFASFHGASVDKQIQKLKEEKLPKTSTKTD